MLSTICIFEPNTLKSFQSRIPDVNFSVQYIFPAKPVPVCCRPPTLNESVMALDGWPIKAVKEVFECGL